MMNANKHIANVIRSNAKGAANCSNVKGFAEDDLKRKKSKEAEKAKEKEKQ